MYKNAATLSYEQKLMVKSFRKWPVSLGDVAVRKVMNVFQFYDRMYVFIHLRVR